MAVFSRSLSTYETWAYALAKKLVANRVKGALGLNQCKHMVSGWYSCLLVSTVC